MDPVKWLCKAMLLYGLFHSSLSSDVITPQHSLRDGDVVVSSGNTFALGFFSPGNSRFRYVGIWYYQVSLQTVVWVANRDNPINDTSGTLSIDSQGSLVLYQRNHTTPVWSTNSSVTHSNDPTAARLLDSGNLVLVQNDTTYWQSFDYPSNTLLSSMRIGLNLTTGLDQFLMSWTSINDPGTGNFTYKIDPTGFAQVWLYKGSDKFWRCGSWSGRRLVGIPEMRRSSFFNYSFAYNEEEISIRAGVEDASIIQRVVANETGLMKRYTWNNQGQRWVEIWSSPKEACDYYGHCGANSNCDQTQLDKAECSCLPGFEPKSPETWFLRDWLAGCVRKANVSICQHGEGFVKVEGVKIPDTAVAIADMSLGLKECRQKCLRNCSCMAYASAFFESDRTGCLTWYGDLLDIMTYTDAGQDLFLRVDDVTLASYKKNGTIINEQMVAILVVSVAVMLSMVGFAFCLVMRRRRRGRQRRPSFNSRTSPTQFEDSLNGTNTELPLFDLGTISAATNNFSSENKLGQGGFGPVYKGTLDGNEIAVKRLSNSSGQGTEEFKNEAKLIAKLQHRNLVRILGCCIEKEEKMLVYEYLPNKSLDCFIFDGSKRSLLDWRSRFEIFSGIARGIVYLHQDSRLRIIHRDLKASNILLDAKMNPKISDFGMARIFGVDQVEANTTRVVGTYGYMSPEYAMEGHFSIKSDVYSFGVLLLEIITGRRNSGHYHDSPASNLIGHVWELWRNGKAIEIVDSSLGGAYPRAEVLRCLQIGLLCVQESATDRPKMSDVVVMLGNDASLPSPKQPSLIVNDTNQGDETGSRQGTGSVNALTLTMPHAR